MGTPLWRRALYHHPGNLALALELITRSLAHPLLYELYIQSSLRIKTRNFEGLGCQRGKGKCLVFGHIQESI